MKITEEIDRALITRETNGYSTLAIALCSDNYESLEKELGIQVRWGSIRDSKGALIYPLVYKGMRVYRIKNVLFLADKIREESECIGDEVV